MQAAMPPALPYLSLREHLKAEWGAALHRLCLDAGFTCPNRDGSKAFGGCTFCDVAGSGASHIEGALGVRRQVLHQIAQCEQRHGPTRYIAYLQAFTNTYAPLDRLRAVYEAAVCHPDVAVLSVGTRSDCVDAPVCELLAGFGDRVQVWLELGLQSVNQATLDRVNRAETPDDFRQACRLARTYGLRVVAHVIVGLPGDTPADYLRAVDLLNAEGVWGVKIHNLYIDRRAPMAADWEAGSITLPTRDEYVASVCDMLERLRPDMVIHRLSGQAPRAYHLAPAWALEKSALLKAITAEMRRRESVQGCRYRSGGASLSAVEQRI